MKQVKLMVLSLAALVFARPTGFCTANTQAEDISVLQEKVAAQEEELKALRAAQTVPAALPEAMPSSTELLIKGAGVEADDVNWRIRAGLSPAQAVEVALLEKNEREAAKKGAKK